MEISSYNLECSHAIDLNFWPPRTLCFSQDDTLFAAGLTNGLVYIFGFHKETGQVWLDQVVDVSVGNNQGKRGFEITALQFASDNEFLAVGTSNGMLCLYHLQHKRCEIVVAPKKNAICKPNLGALSSYPDAVYHIRMAKNYLHFMQGGKIHTLVLNQKRYCFAHAKISVVAGNYDYTTIDLSFDGRYLLICDSRRSLNVYRWDITVGQIGQFRFLNNWPFEEFGQQVNAAVFSRTQNVIYVLTERPLKDLMTAEDRARVSKVLSDVNKNEKPLSQIVGTKVDDMDEADLESRLDMGIIEEIEDELAMEEELARSALSPRAYCYEWDFLKRNDGNEDSPLVLLWEHQGQDSPVFYDELAVVADNALIVSGQYQAWEFPQKSKTPGRTYDLLGLNSRLARTAHAFSHCGGYVLVGTLDNLSLASVANGSYQSVATHFCWTDVVETEKQVLLQDIQTANPTLWAVFEKYGGYEVLEWDIKTGKYKRYYHTIGVPSHPLYISPEDLQVKMQRGTVLVNEQSVLLPALKQFVMRIGGERDQVIVYTVNADQFRQETEEGLIEAAGISPQK